MLKIVYFRSDPVTLRCKQFLGNESFGSDWFLLFFWEYTILRAKSKSLIASSYVEDNTQRFHIMYVVVLLWFCHYAYSNYFSRRPKMWIEGEIEWSIRYGINNMDNKCGLRWIVDWKQRMFQFIFKFRNVYVENEQ